MKRCLRCDQSELQADFGASKSGYCKLCHAERAREGRRRNPEATRARERAQYARNRERYAANARRRRIVNAATISEQKARDHFAGALGGREPDLLAYGRALKADPCSYCGRKPGGHVDHIDPTSSGGRDGWDNLTGCCNSCNPSKSAKPLLLFLAHRHGCWEWRQDAVAA